MEIAVPRIFSFNPQAGVTQRNRYECDLSSENGVILVVFPIVLIFILSIIGLAIDSGRVYHTRLDAQTAVDSAVLSAIGARAGERDRSFLPTDGDKKYIEKRAREALASNLERRGILSTAIQGKRGITRFLENSNRTVDIDVNDSDKSIAVQINASIRVPTLIMGNLSSFLGGGSASSDSFLLSNTVSVSARSEIVPANIVFIADLSESSRCPEIGPCDCNRGSGITCKAEAGVNMSLKYERMQEAFREFINAFDPTRDRISLVFFNNFAWVEVPFRKVTAPGNSAWGFDSAELLAAFDKIVDDESRIPPGATHLLIPKGNTNLADGLLVALEEAQKSGLLAADERVQYVLLTDGAPTAMRVINNEGDDVLNLDFAFPKDPPDPTNPFYHGPGHFINTTAYSAVKEYRFRAPLIPFDGTAPDPESIFPTRMLANCNLKNSPEGIQNVWSQDDAKRVSAAKQCSPGWNFKMPCLQGTECRGFNTGVLEFDGPPLTSGSLTDGEYKRVYYHAAVQAAQAVRNNRGRIYTVGWGPEAVGDPAIDPYQNVMDGMNLKPVLLADMANETSRFESGAYTEYNFKGYKRIRERLQRNPRKELVGAFYNPQSAAELVASLELVSREIKMHLLKSKDKPEKPS